MREKAGKRAEMKRKRQPWLSRLARKLECKAVGCHAKIRPDKNPRSECLLSTMKRSHWALIIVASIMLLLCLAPPLNHKHKQSRAQRIHAVNGLWTATFTLTNSSLSNLNALQQPATN